MTTQVSGAELVRDNAEPLYAPLLAAAMHDHDGWLTADTDQATIKQCSSLSYMTNIVEYSLV